MSESRKTLREVDGRMIVQLTVEELRAVVREEVDALRAELNSQQNAANKDWLRADECAQLYGIPKTWFEERGREGLIARTKPGRYTLFARRDIEAYLERNRGTHWPKRKRKKKDEAAENRR